MNSFAFRLRPRTACWLVLASIALWAGLPFLQGLHGVFGLDLANYAARIRLFALGWGAGDPLPELSRMSGCGEPFVLFNGSLASCFGGLLAWGLGLLGVGPERAVELALRAVYVGCDAGSVLGAYWALRQAGASRAGALVGGAAWGFGWMRRGESIHAANLEHAAFLALLPLAAGLIARIVRRPWAPARPALALALVLAVLVPIHPGLAIIVGVQLALVAVLAAVVRRRDQRLRPVLWGGLLAAGLGALACAWFAGPLLAEREAFGVGVAPIQPEPAASLLDYLDRSLWFSQPGATRFALSPSNYLSSSYAGFSVLVLALAGLGRAWRRAAVCLCLAWASAVISLRPGWTTAWFGPVYGLASIRFAAPAYLWLCVGSALGTEAIVRWLQVRSARRIAPWFGPGVAALAAFTVAVDFGSLEAQAGLYQPQERADEHPLAVGGALLLSPVWDRIASAEPGPGFERVLAVPGYELHQGLVIHGRRLADGLERHGWRPQVKELVDGARGAVEARLEGGEPDSAALDQLGVGWVTTLGLPPRRDLPDLRLEAFDPEFGLGLYRRPAAPPGWFGDRTGAATLTEETDTLVRLEVDGPGGAFTISRQHQRRWVANWEGQELEVRASPEGLAQVVLPPGAGTMTLTLAPWGGRWPVRILTVLAWLAAMLLLWPGARSRDYCGRLSRLITAAA